jgi:predicted PurR-regulated permease PerM
VQSALTSSPLRRRFLYWGGGIVVAIIALYLASRIPRTLTVFGIAATIAFAFSPVVARLEKWRIPRGLAIAAVYLGLIGIVIVLATLVVPATLAQIQSIAINSPTYINMTQGWIDDAQRALGSHVIKSYLPADFENLRGFIAERISLSLAVLLSSFSSILVQTFAAALIGISALVLAAFFLFRGETVFDSFYALLPATRRPSAKLLGHELALVFGGYVSGQLALCAITGLLVFSFTLLAGFKFALLLGIVAAIAYAVPFIGMLVVHVIALVLAAPQGPQTVIWVQVIVFTIARVSDNLLVPKIMSESIGVSPIVVMFATFAGGELFGLPGLLLGIPAAALAKVAWRFYHTNANATAEVRLIPTGELSIDPAGSTPEAVVASKAQIA